MNRRKFATALASAALFSLGAYAAPGRYVVELSDQPAAALAAKEMPAGRASRLRRPAPQWRRHVDAVRSRQAAVRQWAEQRGVRVKGAVSIAANALFVEADEEQARALESLPGVRRVRPVRQYRMTMDAALPLHKALEAWELAGGESQAGEGVKIAIIDSGIETTHPAFNPEGFQAPDGFPKADFDFDMQFTSGKIIVARSYVALLDSFDPDVSARDHVGHGTAVAMVAAGVPHEGPMGWVSGVAPRAWLGNYRVFGTPGFNDTTNDFALLQAIDDALADGMDILNLSLGLDISLRLDEDTLAQAVQNAAAAGAIVVVSAGNNGPGWNSIASPATAPLAISVGASTNSRTFGFSLRFANHPAVLSIPGNGPIPAGPVSGEIADVAALDDTGLACNPLPQGSLAGRVALILRGSCTFETKLNNATAAGAIGAIVQAREDSPDAITMAVGSATLPAMMISHDNGQQIRTWLAGDGTLAVTMDFTFSRVEQQPGRLASFSARGPNVDLAIKPDLLATGTDLWVATQTFDFNGAMYDPTGYTFVDGTSFSAPFVAGAAAVVRSARPGLDAAAIRSALINSSGPSDDEAAGWIQRGGAGLLDVAAAVRAPLVASEVSLSFGAVSTGAVPEPKSLTIRQTGTEPETYFVRVEAHHGPVTPTVTLSQAELAPGAEAQLQVEWPEAVPETGTYDGIIVLEGASGGAVLRLPYWLAATDGQPASFTVLDETTQALRGRTIRDAILFRVVDSNGVPLGDADITVESLDSGIVVATNNYDADSPGVYGITVRLGIRAGANRFRIRTGNAELLFTITGF
ncbi:MAG: S8 family serine peptidase [Bryobacteraceae bacterium]